MQRVRGAGSPAESMVACAADSAWPSTCPPKTYLVPMSRLWPRNRLSSSRSSDKGQVDEFDTGEVMRGYAWNWSGASPQDLGEQAASDVTAWTANSGGASVRVLQVMMAAARSDRFLNQPERPEATCDR